MDSLRLSVIGGTIKYCSIIKIRAGGVVGLIHTSIISAHEPRLSVCDDEGTATY
jgi:hypothetical protein